MNFKRVFGVMLRHYYLSIHQMERAFEVIFFPTMLLFLMGFMANYVEELGFGAVASFIIGGAILWVIFEKVNTDIGISFMFDIWERNLLNFLASPITFLEYMFGIILIGLVKIAVTVMLIGILASVLYNFQLTALGFALGLFWVNLILFAWAFGILNVAFILRFGHTIGPITWSLPFLLQPFSAVFYPISTFPPFVQKIAWFLPTSHVFEGMRGVLREGKFDLHSLLVALILNLIYISLSILFFSFIVRSVKKSGHLVNLV